MGYQPMLSFIFRLGVSGANRLFQMQDECSYAAVKQIPKVKFQPFGMRRTSRITLCDTCSLYYLFEVVAPVFPV